MKNYIDHSMEYYSNICPHHVDVLQHMFAVLGNGVELDNKGYLRGDYGSEDLFNFGKPVPLTSIYPWSDDTQFQPFRKLAGCRTTGFKEAAEYFINCIEVTPDGVDGINKWKENLKIVKEVLLNTPTIEDPYESRDCMDKFLKEIEGDKTSSQAPVDGTVIDASNSVYKKWFFDVQWSDCPSSVEEEVRSSWRDHELGNDNYFWAATLGTVLFQQYPKIYFWLKHKGVTEDEQVIIHWWW